MHRFQCHVEQVEQMPLLGFKQVLQLMITTLAAAGLAIWQANVASAASSPCPSVGAVVNGRAVWPGSVPRTITMPSGESRTVISLEMAMAPIELLTASGMKLRVPASALRLSPDCDARGRFRHIRLLHYWTNNRLVTPAEAPADSAGAIFTSAHFDGTREIPDAQERINQRVARGALSPPESIPQYGLVAYSLLGRPEPDKWWYQFVLTEARTGLGQQIQIACDVRKSDLLEDRFPARYRGCRTHLEVVQGFYVIVDIQPPHLKNANKLFDQLRQVLTSYIVKE
jgi:hypothetical protein